MIGGIELIDMFSNETSWNPNKIINNNGVILIRVITFTKLTPLLTPIKLIYPNPEKRIRKKIVIA